MSILNSVTSNIIKGFNMSNCTKFTAIFIAIAIVAMAIGGNILVKKAEAFMQKATQTACVDVNNF